MINSFTDCHGKSEDCQNSHNILHNVILFGLPESSLPNTKADIDVVQHLIGRSSSIKDAFRLGCRKKSCVARR